LHRIRHSAAHEDYGTALPQQRTDKKAVLGNGIIPALPLKM
jgi:hypothetical protein